MKNQNRILYALIGILLGVIVILSAVLYLFVDRLHELEQQAQRMEDAMNDALLRVRNDSSGDGNVDAEYVDVADEKQPEPTETEVPKEDAKAEPEGDANAAEEFNDLQPQMEAMIAGFQNQVRGEWSVYVEDLNRGGSMSINESQMRAASLIKLYIMGAVYEHYGTLSAANGNLDSLLGAMITVSDNDAANELVRLLGDGDANAGMMAVNAFCTQYNFTSTSMGRLLLEENPSGENYTSVGDCGKFLYNVYCGEFEHSSDMEGLLRAQERQGKIPAGVPEGVEVANKTGELTDVQNDAAIIFADKPYILCVMSQGVSGEEAPIAAIVRISDAVYGYTNQT